mgnify:CR=1 FL=1
MIRLGSKVVVDFDGDEESEEESELGELLDPSDDADDTSLPARPRLSVIRPKCEPGSGCC